MTTHAPDPKLYPNHWGSVFRVRQKPHQECRIFLDDAGPVDIARFDSTRYSVFEKQLELMNAGKWEFREINLRKDKIDYYTAMTPAEQHIFTSNIKRQIVLDSVAGRGISEALLPLVSDPTVESCIHCIAYFENNIHAQAYQHILRGIYNDPSEVFDDIKNIVPILELGRDVSKYYDQLINYTMAYKLNQAGTEVFELKRRLWLFLMALNALEGLRFYVSFACSFAFGITERMVGNASEIRMIANDEALHVAFTTTLIRRLPEDDPDYLIIEKMCREEAHQIYMDVVDQEKTWVDYLFQHGSMLGLNGDMLKSYMDYMAAKRMKAIGLVYPVTDAPTTNPLPWMNTYLNEENSQPAPQETEITSYTKGAEADVETNSFREFRF